MKKLYILSAALVLTALVFTGCGCRNSRPAETLEPSTMPTVMTTEATTEATTMPTEMTIMPEGTIQDGNGPMEDLLPTESTGANGNTGISGDAANSSVG